METNRLKHFCAVAELESLSKAAELLSISHSGLHKSLRVLENELGYSLTLPKGRGITLTAEAKFFYPQALKIINLVEDCFDADKKREQKFLKIGGVEVFVPLLSSRLATDPLLSGANLELHEFGPGELEQAVKDKTLDYGLTYIPVSMQGLQFLKITDFRMGIFYNNKKFKDLDVTKLPFVIPYSPLVNNPADIKNRDGWASTKFQRRVKYKVNSLFTALELVKSGLAAIYTPDFIGERFQKTLFKFNLNDKTLKDKRSVYLILRDESTEDQYAKKISRLIRSGLK